MIVILFSCQSTPKGGAVPKIDSDELKLDVINIDWSDLSLSSGDRRIKGTGFVVKNWSDSSDDIGKYFGVIGAFASDLLNEKKLKGKLETEIKKEYDLAQILLTSLKNNDEIRNEVSSINLNSNFKKQVIVLEPWCVVTSGKYGLKFTPQLKATLLNASGKSIWEENYGPLSGNKPLSYKESLGLENKKILRSRLNIAYEEITKQLLANIQGNHRYVSEEESDQLTEELLKDMNIEIPMDESLFNKPIKRD
jgi:hypothetical protein